MNFFGGLSAPEIALVLDISLATVERDWATAWVASRNGRSAARRRRGRRALATLKELLHQALPLTPARRAALLDVECAGEPELRVRNSNRCSRRTPE